jgi:SAM-dependent methyltransferase
MDPNAMTPYGLALSAFFRGETEAKVLVRRDDGFEVPLPVSHFFRQPAEFSPIEVAALDHCRGRVLDVGAGTGIHSLALRARGLAVTAMDLSPDAVEIMTARGLDDVRRADVFDFEDGPFDTLLMLGHGVGIVEDLPGLDRFLLHARRLVRAGGQLLLDSQDARRTDDPRHLAYHETNRRAGRYFGMTRIQFEYEGQTGPYCGWLHVDSETLRRHAAPAGWECEVVRELNGDYLACLTDRGEPAAW